MTGGAAKPPPVCIVDIWFPGEGDAIRLPFAAPEKPVLSADNLLGHLVATLHDKDTVGGVGNLTALEVEVLGGSISNFSSL